MTERKLLIVRLQHFPGERRPHTAAVPCCPVYATGVTPESALRSLFRRLVNHVRTAGLPARLSAAPLLEKNIRTYLPEVVLGCKPPSAGTVLYAVPWDFNPVVLALTAGELLERARSLRWEPFETGFLYDFPPRWEPDLATAFNRFLARGHGLPAKPVTVTIRRGCNLLGEHGPDRIRLQRGLAPLKTWQVLLHELAHYRAPRHGRAFVVELARVYALWRHWLATRAKPERASQAGARDTPS